MMVIRIAITPSLNASIRPLLMLNPLFQFLRDDGECDTAEDQDRRDHQPESESLGQEDDPSECGESGTGSCTVAARVADRPRRAVYQMTYPIAEEAIQTGSRVECPFAGDELPEG